MKTASIVMLRGLEPGLPNSECKTTTTPSCLYFIQGQVHFIKVTIDVLICQGFVFQEQIDWKDALQWITDNRGPCPAESSIGLQVE